MMEAENDVSNAGEEYSVDWDSALKRVGGSKEALQEIVQIFCADECPQLTQSIREALVKQDAVVVSRAAHTLKSSADLFGAKRAFDAAQRLEHLASQSDIPGATEAWEILEPELASLHAALANLEC